MFIKFKFLLFMLFLINLVLGSGCSDNKTIFDRALLSAGNTSLLKKVMLKAEKGERIVVGLIGGSITQGAKASHMSKSYAYQAAIWWEENFPNADIGFVNAGIGSTGSDIGVFRLNRHLLRFKPDIVIVEFSVNDSNTEKSAETLEGIIRQSFNRSDPPAIILLMMCNAKNEKELVSAQKWHSKIGYHYNLPMISLKGALSSGFQSGNLKADKIFADGLHPNDFGHKLVADLVCSFFKRVKNELKGPQKQLLQELPRPLISKRFDHTDFFQPGDINPFLNKGWRVGPVRRFRSAWESGISGSEIGFEVEGAEISLLYDRDQNAGIVEVFVDDLPPQKINASTSSYPSPSVTKILSRQKSEKHKIVIKSIDGNSFKLIAFMTAFD
ncbi:MAG: SGNH/GDSL hydrolase family protein [Desulfobacteraceae bacterium]|jgi:acyl-CoA thioesterase-1|nr:SGNH/GDSL hydrolase family protein [Desulfobacteraceae bacterium]